jgi:hypothetical protein
MIVVASCRKLSNGRSDIPPREFSVLSRVSYFVVYQVEEEASKTGGEATGQTVRKPLESGSRCIVESFSGKGETASLGSEPSNSSVLIAKPLFVICLG